MNDRHIRISRISNRMKQYDIDKKRNWLNPVFQNENKQEERIRWKSSNEHTGLYE